MNKKKLILHIGAHKTASTSLQKSLKRLSDSTKVISVHEPDQKRYINFRIRFSSEIFQFEKNKKANLVGDDDAKRLSSLFKEYLLQFEQDTVIWSDENLLGTPTGHRIGNSNQFNTALYPASPLVCRAFELLADCFDIKVLCVIRRQDFFLESCFKDWIIKLDEATTYEQFLARLKLNELSWYRVLTPWGKESLQLRVLCYEELLMDPQHFYAQVYEWLELQEQEIPQSNKLMANQSISLRQVNIANKLIPNLNQDEKLAAQNFIRSLDPGTSNELMCDKRRMKLLKILNSENRRLSQFVSSSLIGGYQV